MFKKIHFLSFIVMLFAAFSMNAQVTTSALSVTVTDDTEEALIGATVVATHLPSGTKYNAVSNLAGLAHMQGMRTGGPYRVQVSYIGYETRVVEGVVLQLGNTYMLDVHLSSAANQLSEVVITGDAHRQEAGASHNFSVANIENAATVNRNIYDVVKNMPMASTSKVGGISFAGSNNRYNSFQIDGTVSNDVFGLAASGTNGGQASANPISMDAIQEIQVVVAPFDVRQSGFTGGGINAITKQGTNDFHATFYTYYNNQNFYGRYNAARGDIKDKLTKQHATTIGGNISGPIAKDKLFFFLNLENHNESYPASFYPGMSGDYLSEATVKQIADKYYKLSGIQESYGRRDVKRNAFDLLARIDWNINDNNKLALRYQHGNAYDDKWSAGTTSYYFNNSSYRFNNVTNSFVAELNSNIGSGVYNELRASYNRIRDSRDVPYQGPLFWIKNVANEDNTRSNIAINIGTEYSSGANFLDQDVYLLEDNLSWYKGRHTITLGTHNEFFKMRNLFIQSVTGEWVYNSLDDFMNDAPNQFVFKCTNPAITNGDLRWTPIIKAGQLGLYLQDKFEVNRNLQLTYGLRVDLPFMYTRPTDNVEFNQYAYQKGWDAKVGQMPSAKPLFSPRFGFRWYTDDSHNTLLRGGLGLFTGRVPFVWLSNAFSNTGVEITGTTINQSSGDPMPNVTTNTSELLEFITDKNAPRPDIVTVSKKFRYPQVFRANLALEQRLPGDVKFTLEGLYSKTYNQAYFKNLALSQSASIYAIEGVEASAAPFFTVDRKYYSVINTENTNKGYTYSISATLEKNFDFGLDVLASYTFGHSKSVYDGTSSVAYSNWKYNYAVNTYAPSLTYSSFDQPHRILVNVGYTTPKYANGWLQTTIGLTYNAYSGFRYSLTMNENSDYNGDGQRGNSMLYLPTDDELDKMVFVDNNGKTADEQRELFREFLANDSYAKNHRGEYAERNGNIAPFEHQLDLHLAQSIFALRERGSKIMLTFDVLNFANMLNKKWGAVYSSSYNVTPLNCTKTEKVAEGVYRANYTWNGYTEPTKNAIFSRWHAQVGVKLIF
ncbi:MAG: carboxypeptidase regulatory-like domain-containing protein [Muribaculaceae bacterium]|nr:carboxypeptidase regulatory-like domain-containing protein [Muribaculaceae bacterium]